MQRVLDWQYRCGLWGGVCLLTTVLCCPGEVRADAAGDYNLAAGLYKQKSWTRAAKAFEEYLKNHPQHDKVPMAKFYLGLTHVNRDDYKAAREVLRDFVKSYPTNPNIPQAQYRVAECSYLLDDMKSAQPELQEFIAKHPQDTLLERALPYLGDAQLRNGSADAALATFDKALKEYPKGALLDDARFGRAKALEGLKRDADAIAQYREIAALKDSPRAPEAQFQIAARQFESKQFPESAASYLDLLQRFPKSSLGPSARLNAGYALYQAEKFPEAAQQFSAAQKDPQNSVTAGYWRGLCLKATGDLKQAAQLFAGIAKEAGDGPLAESIQFQHAVCLRQSGDVPAALDLFAKSADKWPKGEFADDCLHAAAEIALDAGEIAQATTFLTRFTKEFPGSGLRLHADLLLGRIDLAEASAATKAKQPPNIVADRYKSAGEKFAKVLQDSTIPRTQLLARYYLGLARQLQNQHEEVVKVVGPLVEAVQTEGAKSEFGDALPVLAESQLALKQFDGAQATAEKYLSLFPKGRQVPRALFAVAIAGAQRDSAAASNAAADRLTKDFRTHAVTPIALLQLAELAEAKQDWPAAAARYTALAGISEGTENQAFAIRGLAWAQFKQKQYGPAAEQFAKVIKQFPKHKLNSECSFYLAESLREDGQLEKATAGYVDVFQRFSPETPAATGAEKEAPLLYAYRAGLQWARSLRQLKKIADADKAYAAILEKFPKPLQHERLLDEWALMNYEAENYEKADAIFRRLIAEAPNSELADNAQLSLAESDLLNDKLDEAKKTFEGLLASPTSDAEVKERSLYQLIVLAVEQERWADVRSSGQRFAKEFSGSPHVPYAQYSEAESILVSPKADANELAQAKQLLEAVVQSASKELPPDAFQGRAWVLLAEVAFREKKYDDAARLADDLKKTQPKSTFVYQMEELVGRCHKQQADFPAARAAFERVLADPQAFRTATAAKSQFLIAETYFLEKKWEPAFLAYQKVYSSYNFPDWQSAALYQSGQCEEQLENWKDAVKTYEQLIEEFPQSVHINDAKPRLEVARKKAGS